MSESKEFDKPKYENLVSDLLKIDEQILKLNEEIKISTDLLNARIADKQKYEQELEKDPRIV